MGWSSERKEEYDLATKELPYAQQERMTKWTMNDIRWPMSIYITLMHVLAIVGVTINDFMHMTYSNALAQRRARANTDPAQQRTRQRSEKLAKGN